jgi:RNA polymerase sigma-70 factor (ECF subfamily)
VSREEEQVRIAALQQGDERTFRLLVETYQERVLNTCLGFVPSRHDAEDLAQEVFVEVYRSVGGFRGQCSLNTWIYRITVSKCLAQERYRRRQKRMVFFQAIIGLDAPEAQAAARTFDHPGIALEQAERAEVLFAALQQLPDNQRAAFVLQKVEGLSAREAGEVLKLSVAATEALTHRAKKRLQELLKAYYLDVEKTFHHST